jgi:hypothetical protein
MEDTNPLILLARITTICLRSLPRPYRSLAEDIAHDIWIERDQGRLPISRRIITLRCRSLVRDEIRRHRRHETSGHLRPSQLRETPTPHEADNSPLDNLVGLTDLGRRNLLADLLKRARLSEDELRVLGKRFFSDLNGRGPLSDTERKTLRRALEKIRFTARQGVFYHEHDKG